MPGRREKMVKKGGIPRVLSMLVFTALLVTDLVYAQMTPIFRFKGAQLPVRLKIQDKILEKGAYDVEFLRTSSPVLFFVRFLRRGKILGVVQGEEWPYAEGIVSDIAADKTIPNSPTLKMGINRDEKLLQLVFESGRHSVNYPMVRAIFKLPYVE
jgi:hypothetical protein